MIMLTSILFKIFAVTMIRDIGLTFPILVMHFPRFAMRAILSSKKRWEVSPTLFGKLAKISYFFLKHMVEFTNEAI